MLTPVQAYLKTLSIPKFETPALMPYQLSLTCRLTEMSQQINFRCLSQVPVMNAHASLRTYAESSEHSRVLYTINVCRWTLVWSLRPLALLGSCSCISIEQHHAYAKKSLNLICWLKYCIKIFNSLIATLKLRYFNNDFYFHECETNAKGPHTTH